MNSTIAILVQADLRSLTRARWLLAAAGLGAVVLLGLGLTSDGTELQRNAAGVFSLGGLALALGIGAPALVRDLERGTFALSASAGASLTDLGWSRLISRSIGVLGVLGIWALAAQIGAALGGRADEALLIHMLLTALVFLMVMLAAAGAATLMGVVAGGIFGIAVLISAQAIVNVKAADDQGLLGSGGELVQAAYWFLPRMLISPMIASLQRADEGGPVAPQFEINGNVADIPSSGVDSVLWVIAWCGIFFGLSIVGLRRREL